MIKLQSPPKNIHKGLIITALVFLCNANISVVDPLPDFVGYFMLMGVFAFASRRVPYLEEVRAGFLKLALLSLARIPALFLIVKIRSVNTTDNDIYVLASFVFAVLEIFLSYGVIKNLFDGLSFLGDRTGRMSIIGEKPSSDFLKKLTITFVLVKCAGYSLPEFARLTTADGIGTLTTQLEGMRYYPITFLTAQLLTYAMGLVWVAYFVRYLKRLHAEGDFYEAIMSLSNEENEKKIAHKMRLASVASGFTLLIPATLFTFDLKLSNLRGINILPHFILGIFLIFAVLKLMTKVSVIHISALATAVIYTNFSFYAWIKSIEFFENHTIFETLLYDDADEAYRVVESTFLIEMILLIIALLVFSLALIRTVKLHTGSTPFSLKDPFTPNKEKDYTAHDRKYHVGMTVRVWVFFALGAILALLRYLSVVFNNERVFAHSKTGVVLMPEVAPWISIAVFVVACAWCIFTYCMVTTLKEELHLKYSGVSLDELE